MTKQNKNARNIAAAKAITSLHKNGGKGPAKTTPKHGKRFGYRDNPETLKRIAELAKAASTAAAKEKTSGKKILAEAGGASA
jgi:hypothetical protein